MRPASRLRTATKTPSSSDGREERRARADALQAWHAGVAAVDAESCVERALSANPDLVVDSESTLVVATGKAAAAMARGASAAARTGYVLVPHSQGSDQVPSHFHLASGGHPVPDREGMQASRSILEAVGRLDGSSTLLYLVSGGTSSLLEVPAVGIAEDDLIDTYEQLLLSGASIAEINCVRRALSTIKGGGLARAAYPARVITLAVSDVAGDDPEVIGSGPTVLPEQGAGPDSVVDRWGLSDLLADSVVAHLKRAELTTTEKDRRGCGPYLVVASNEAAVKAARQYLCERGYELSELVPDAMEGDCVDEADRLARLIPAGGAAGKALVLGGEATVRVSSPAGSGGRCQHLAAALVSLIAGGEGLACVVAGTDGVDGNSGAAGAIVTGSTAERASLLGMDAGEFMSRFDTAAFFSALGDQIVTGPTGTNVADLLVAVTATRGETGS